jgi:hypothetical protein
MGVSFSHAGTWFILFFSEKPCFQLCKFLSTYIMAESRYKCVHNHHDCKSDSFIKSYADCPSEKSVENCGNNSNDDSSGTKILHTKV